MHSAAFMFWVYAILLTFQVQTALLKLCAHLMRMHQKAGIFVSVAIFMNGYFYNRRIIINSKGANYPMQK